MSLWRPTPDEERWLEVEARLRGSIARGAVGSRAGGWRITGPFARLALFVLGVLAAGLTTAILGLGDEESLLAAGLIAAVTAEWLKVGRRLQASGIEEGLCAAGYLLLGLWLVSKTHGLLGVSGFSGWSLAAVVAGAAAGFRVLNPLLTTLAAVVFLDWFGSTPVAHAVDATAGEGMAAFVLACAATAAALGIGARDFRRPAHDRMLDWLVVVLPVFGYWQQASWHVLSVVSGAPGTGTVRLLTATLLLVLAVTSLVVGVRRRRHAPLLAFLACTACLAAELLHATEWPPEFWLVLYGCVALGGAAVVDRYLRRPRAGITSSKLTDREGPLDLLQIVGAAIATQQSSPQPSPAEPVASPHEGRFGGGGASGSF